MTHVIPRKCPSAKILSVLVASCFAVEIYANPTGPSVVSGIASFATSGKSLTVTNSPNAIINWQGFSIGTGEITRFQQQSASSAVLNRVVGQDPSAILGTLSSNGRVYLVNPNGILFGQGSRVDVAGLVATTLNLSNNDFLAGRLNFESGAVAKSIVNQGEIVSASGGRILLIAPDVQNHGLISSPQGEVVLAAGKSVQLVEADLPQLKVEVQAGGEALNVGKIIAEGGKIGVYAGLIKHSGTVRADSATAGPGGSIRFRAQGAVNLESGSVVSASGADSGGTIDVAGDVVINSAQINANGADGGAVAIEARNYLGSGTVSADGSTGSGGQISIAAAGGVIQTASESLTARGAIQGGSVSVSTEGQAFSSATLDASGGRGGSVTVLARDVRLYGASLDASGQSGGGTILVGGDYKGGNPAVSNAESNWINFATQIRADAGESGNGGKVIVWSDNDTRFGGNISVQGGARSGDGGFVEVSGKESLVFAGNVNAQATNGQAGTVLLDPKNINIDAVASGSVSSFQLVDPNPGASQQFPYVTPNTTTNPLSVVALANGNVVATDPFDSAVANSAGAVYLFNSSTGALLSTLTGSSLGDQVGSGGVKALTGNNNYVVSSPLWGSLGTSPNARGAVTWASGSASGVQTVSSSNSLVGLNAGDRVGSRGVTALTNGNYVVASPLWSNGSFASAGAVTWGSGTAGVAGSITSANSLVGTSSFDSVGNAGVVALTNGNYVAISDSWINAGVSYAGAVTWGNGTTGTTGAITTSNSLVGNSQFDQVGYFGGVVALTNGNYVVISQYWDNTTAVNSAGAVTWGSGTSGIAGTISSVNSLVGTSAFDNVGNGGVTALTNGNYVVNSKQWSNGGVTQAGAVTWGSGTVGVKGAVTSANSLVGTSALDQVGRSGVTALSNGNYVVASSSWNNSALTAPSAGAVTWGNGSTGITGTVSSGNSLVGTQSGESVGDGGVAALTNGNYVVASPYWRSGTVVDAGAATWRNGTAASPGTITGANSLVGTTAGDRVGLGGVRALTNGNYVVVSQNWNNGAATQVGAATWANGSTGTTGTVTTANSVIGTQSGDQVGSGGISALSNGNYVIASPNWANGTVSGAGAVTWRNGASASGGTVSSANSLVGSALYDLTNKYCPDNCYYQTDVHALPGGDYVVRSSQWNNGATTLVGAVTWGSGASGVSGTVSTANSVIGSQANDQLGSRDVIPVAGGQFVVSSPLMAQGTASLAGALHVVAPPGAFSNPLQFATNATGTTTITPASIAALTSQGTAVTLQANNDISVNAAVTSNNTSGNGGAITMQAGRSVLVKANITTDNGNLSITANDPTAQSGNRDGLATVAGGFTMDPGTTLNAGTGTVTLTVGPGPGGALSGHLVVENITAANVNLQQLGGTSGSSILPASATSLIQATDLLMETDLATGASGASIGTSGTPGALSGPMRVQVTSVEAHTHQASPGIYVESPNAGNLQVGGVSFFGGAVKGVQNITSGDIAIAANGNLILIGGSSNIPCGTGTGGPICTTSGNVTLRADGMAINHSVAGTGTVVLAPYDLSRQVNIESSVIGGVLSLTPTMISRVSTPGTLEIGRNDSNAPLLLTTPLTSANVNAGTLRLYGGTIYLSSSTADIGSSGTPFNHNLDLRANHTVTIDLGNIHVADNKSLNIVGDRDGNLVGNVDIGGVTVRQGTGVSNTTGSMSVSGAGVTVAVSGGGSSVIEVAGGGTQTLTATAGNLTFQNSNTSAGSLLVQAGTNTQTLNATGALRILGGTGTNTSTNVTTGTGSQSVTTGSIVMAGGDSGTGNFAQLNSGGGQTINAAGISVTGGTAGTSNYARIAQTNAAAAQGITVTGGGTMALLGGGGTSNYATVSNAGVSQQVSFSAAGNLSVTGGSGASADFASISATSGSQSIIGTPVITLRGGTGGAGGLSTSNFALITVDSAQSQTVNASNITITGGDSGSLNRALILHTNTGAQTVNATGITIDGGLAGSNEAGIISEGGQTITAGAGGLTLRGGVGGSGGNASISQQGSTSDQMITINNDGIVRLTGGGGTTNRAHIENRGKAQSITFSTGGKLLLQGGAGASGNEAIVENDTASATTQTISFGIPSAVVPEIKLTGGTVGNSNHASIGSNGDQLLTGNPDIRLLGGASGGSVSIDGNNAGIVGGGTGKLQTINARDISLSGGNAGALNGVVIGSDLTGLTSVISATGSLNLAGGAGTDAFAFIGGIDADANVTVNVTGPITLTGGSGANVSVGSRAGIGAVGIPAGPYNANVTINGQSSISLSQGGSPGFANAFIGSPGGGGGTITVNSGLGGSGGITLNSGTLVRTAGSVTLKANGANNDITLGGVVNTSSGSGSGTAITLDAGRAIVGAGGILNTSSLQDISLKATAGIGTPVDPVRLNLASGGPDEVFALNTTSGDIALSATGGLVQLDGTFSNFLNSSASGKYYIKNETNNIQLDVPFTPNGAALLAGQSVIFDAPQGSVKFNSGGRIDATGSGAVTLIGGNAGTAGLGSGVVIDGGRITTDAGAITITGTGKTNAGSGNFGGVVIGDTVGTSPAYIHSNTGPINITGTGGSMSGVDFRMLGVRLFGTNSEISTGGGSIALTGTGGTMTNAPACTPPCVSADVRGMRLEADTRVSTTGSGNITLTGTGGTLNNPPANAVIGGVLTLGSVTTVDGNITISGTGGTTSGGTGGQSRGVSVSGTAESTGTGSISIAGTGSLADTSTAPLSHLGVLISGPLVVRTTDGNITIQGTGGVSTGTSAPGYENAGIHVQGGGANTIAATGTGAVSITGSGGSSAGVPLATGISIGQVSNALSISTASGNLGINATGDLQIDGGTGIPISISTSTGPQTISSTANIAIGVTGGVIDVASGGTQSVSATGSLDLAAGSGAGEHVLVRSTGNQSVSASNISVNGGAGATSANNYASIYQSGTSGTQTITVNGGGTLAIQGGSSSSNAYAFVSANGTAQTIAFPAGGTINIQGGNTGTGNGAGIYAANGSQSITGAPAIYLTGGPSGGASGAGNYALISAGLGAQNIAAGTIELYGGDAGVSNFARLYSSGNQTIGATGVTLWGGLDGGAPGAGNFAQIRSDASQTLSIGSGGLYLIGGSGSQTTASDNFASIYQAGTSGTQAINVAAGSAIYVFGGDGVATNVDTFNNHGTWAYIRADGTSQIISFAGPGGMIHVVGGDNGSGNYAGINARNGSQTVTGSPDIHILGGATGGVAGEGNWAQLYASAGTQTITANSIALMGGDGFENYARMAGGTQQNIAAADLSLTGGVSSTGTANYAVVQSPIQVISTTGDVTLTGGAAAATATSGGGSRVGGFGGASPSATSVTMTVGGNLHLVGGSATDSGSSIGSGITGGQTTDVTLNVTGNVTLDPGTVASAGSRLGSPASSVAAGTIAVTAGGNITMNGTASGIGTAIRTSGNVSLAANSVTQATYSTILANQLTTATAAGASLLGAGNAVAAFGASNTASGAIALLNASPTLTLGSPSQVAGAPVNVTQTGDLILPTMTIGTGTISASGTASIPSGVTVTAAGGTLSAATLDVQLGGTLNGTGTVTANVSNSGTVAPGTSAGKLTVSGNYAQTSGGKLTVEIGGTTAGTDYDQLAVTGAATLGGTLNVVEGTLAAAPGTTYSVITCGSCTGAFATVNSPTINATPTYGATSFTLPFTSFLNAWNGSTAADWNDPANWSRGSVPTASDDVVIDVPSTVATITVSTGTQSARSIVTSENLTLSGGSLNLAAPSTVNGAFTLSGGTVAGSGNLTLNGTFNWSAGTISNTGVLTTTGTSTVSGGGSRSISGAWANSGNASIDATSLTAVGGVTNSGTMSLSGTSLSGLLTNSGSISVAGTVNASGGIQQNAGLITVPLGQAIGVGGSGLVLAGGTLMGGGTISGNVNNSAGTVAPGASPGLLTISGNYTQGPSGVLATEIAEPAVAGSLPVAGVDYDQLKVIGNVQLAGSLTTTVLGTYSPPPGQQYTFIDASGTISGSFVNVSQPAVLLPPVAGPSPTGGTQLAVSVVSPNVPAPIEPSYNYTVVATELSSEPVENILMPVLGGETTTTTSGETTLEKKPPSCS